VYVFGSVIEGKNKPMSDVDVAVVIRDSAWGRGKDEALQEGWKKFRSASL